MQSRNLRSALWYARKMKWYVVPLYAPIFDESMNCTGCTCEKWIRENRNPDYTCKTPGKHPRFRDWEEKATRDASEIEKLWGRDPLMNIGIAAGKSGVLCLDIDSYKDSFQGAPFLSSADEETLTSITGSGGSHVLYAINPDDKFSNANADLPTGIDIRCWGGQFLVPPSIHPTGKRYAWELGYAPHERSILPLPTGLRNILESMEERRIESGLVQFDENCKPPDFSHITVREDILQLIHTSPPVPTKGVDSFRSENDQRVITALVYAGATDSEIKALFDYYPIGRDGKYAEKGAHALDYLRLSISHARGFVATKKEEVIEVRTENFFKEALKAYRF